MTSFKRCQLPNHHGCALKISNSVPPTPYKTQLVLALHIMLIRITTQSLQMQIFTHFLWSHSNFCSLLGVPFHRAAFNRLVPCVPTSCLRFIFCLSQLLMFHFLSSPSFLCFTFCLHPWQEVGLQVITNLHVWGVAFNRLLYPVCQSAAYVSFFVFTIGRRLAFRL